MVVGSANRDLSVETPAFPQPGETVLGTSVRTSMGGKGANQAVAAALAGARVAMIAHVGDDDAGTDVRTTLDSFGIDTALVRAVGDAPTATASIMVAEGENAIVVVPGANHRWDSWPDSADRDLLAEAPVVLAQLEIPVPVVAAASDLAGGRFVLNAAPGAELDDDLLARCAVLVVNENELTVVSGGTTDVDAAHSALRRRGVGAVITTLGPRGAVVTDDSGTWSTPSPPSTALDTTGAGDAFAGVLAAKLAGGLDLREATRWAVAAGSWAVRSSGTYESYADAGTLAALV